MGEVCKDYEVRFHRADGSLSLVMILPALSDRDAKRQAEKMLSAGLTNAHIWNDGELVDSIYKIQ